MSDTPGAPVVRAHPPQSPFVKGGSAQGGLCGERHIFGPRVRHGDSENLGSVARVQQPLSDVVIEKVAEAVQLRLLDFAGTYSPGKRSLDFNYRKAGDIASGV